MNADPALSILDLVVGTCEAAEALGGRRFEVNYYNGTTYEDMEISAVNITVHVYGCCSNDDCKAPGADTADSKYTCTIHTIQNLSAYKIIFMTNTGRVHGSHGKTSLEHGP